MSNSWRDKLEKLKEENGGHLTQGKMSIDDMAILLELYHQTIPNATTNLLNTLIGKDIVVGYKDGFLGSLSKLGIVISNEISPDIKKYESTVIENKDSIWDSIINDPSLSYTDKAKLLLGYNIDEKKFDDYDILISVIVLDNDNISFNESSLYYKLNRDVYNKTFKCDINYGDGLDKYFINTSIVMNEQEETNAYKYINDTTKKIISNITINDEFANMHISNLFIKFKNYFMSKDLLKTLNGRLSNVFTIDSYTSSPALMIKVTIQKHN